MSKTKNPKCCGVPGKFLFTSSDGTAFYKCKNCGRFYTPDEAMGEKS
jgi:uncharacterized OB-fold protein